MTVQNNSIGRIGECHMGQVEGLGVKFLTPNLDLVLSFGYDDAKVEIGL
jgi:hypothetical protein